MALEAVHPQATSRLTSSDPFTSKITRPFKQKTESVRRAATCTNP
nr:MAG TPA: hypothetical protein [Caudoviricetes sp.]